MTINKKIFKGSFVVMAGLLISNVFSLFKEIIVTRNFGASASMDAFFVALTVPTFLFIFANAASDAFIPFYTGLQSGVSEEKARYFVNLVVSFLLAILGLCMIAVCIFTPQLITILSPGVAPSTKAVAVSITRVFSVLVVLNGLISIITVIFQAHKKFSEPSFTTIIVPAVTIVSVILLSDRVGVYSIVYGLMVGTGIQLAVLLTLLQRFRGAALMPAVQLNDPALGQFIKIMVPMLMTRILSQLNVIVDKMMASVLAVGSISVLSWGSRIYSVFFQLFIYSVYRVLIPFFSQQVADNDIDGLKKTSETAIIMSALVLLPVTVGICMFSEPLVRFVFERGKFSAEAAHLTALAFTAYSLGLFWEAASSIYFAMLISFKEMNKILMLSIFAGIIPNVLFNYILMRYFGTTGIALSTAIVSFIGTVAYYLVLKNRIGRLLSAEFTSSMLKTALASLGSGAWAYGLFQYLKGVELAPHMARNILSGACIVLTTGAVYLALIGVLRVRESGRLFRTLGIGRFLPARLRDL